MAVDNIETFIVYSEEPPVGDIARYVSEAGWDFRTEDGRIRYKVDHERRYAYSPEELYRSIDAEDAVSVTFCNDGLEITVTTGSDIISEPVVCLWLPTLQVDHEDRSEQEAVENTRKYLDAVRLVVTRTSPLYGFGGLDSSIEPGRVPSLEEISTGDLPHLFWLLLVPLESTENGLEWDYLRNAPCWLTERVTPAMAMLVMTDNAYHPSQDWTTAQQQMTEFLREHQANL